jgi:hypothetical protein
LVSFTRRYGGLWQPHVVLSLCRIAVAAAVAGLVMWAVQGALLGGVAATASSMGRSLSTLTAALLAGGASYALLCFLMGVKEVSEVAQALRRRLGRFRGRPSPLQA